MIFLHALQTFADWVDMSDIFLLNHVRQNPCSVQFHQNLATHFGNTGLKSFKVVTPGQRLSLGVPRRLT